MSFLAGGTLCVLRLIQCDNCGGCDEKCGRFDFRTPESGSYNYVYEQYLECFDHRYLEDPRENWKDTIPGGNS